jgi:peptidoglycan/xylan/chitin deacetylase (PgdA/CDA1 family)
VSAHRFRVAMRLAAGVALAFAIAASAAATCGAGVTAARDDAWGGVPVLMYHKVDANVPRDPVGRDLTVEPKTFAAQLDWLRKDGIRTLTAAQLVDALARGEHPRRAVVLTFDDGYADAATTALPLLRAAGAIATFYISSGFVGTPRHLSWKQIRALREAGMEVACHGTYHLDLATLDRTGQRREAQHCVEAFRRYLGAFRPATYAYPAGKYNAGTLAMLKQLGFRAAFTEHPGTVRSLATPFELPRRRVRHDDDLASFAALATP